MAASLPDYVVDANAVLKDVNGMCAEAPHLILLLSWCIRFSFAPPRPHKADQTFQCSIVEIRTSPGLQQSKAGVGSEYVHGR